MTKVIIIQDELEEKERRRKLNNLKDMINGSLNRMCVTDSILEIDEQCNNLVHYINKIYEY